MSKPGDFLLGILDFFAILLPGAAAAVLVLHYVANPLDGLKLSAEVSPTAGWLAFLFASYVLGHLIFMVGSRLDTVYDARRRRTKPPESDATYRAAKALHESLTPELHPNHYTTLKWARSYVQLKSPAARLDIDRLEATQKFFRSMVVVAVVAALHFLFTSALLLAIVCALLALACFDRFCDQRWKMTELSYATAVIIAAVGAKSAPDDSKPKDNK